ncbi:MAG: imidazole glycerol phosphate synthase subunit HisF [Spirochaetaceae bacterium]|nr:MAG: imidazole glycerol phosphate synthase subunit HisF [Spirochaetaceae bacterium]
MLEKRLVVCLDVRDGKTTKGIKFQGNVDIGDPVEMARQYYEQGVDELVFYDITASSEQRGIFIDVVERVAAQIFVPFCVGGGIGSVEDMRAVLLAGAEKISVNSQAVLNPEIINAGAAAFGAQCIVLGMDAARDPDMKSGYRVVINGGRTPTDKDALEWALEAEHRGAGEIVLNSIDADGTQDGYEIPLTRMISEAVGIPVVASGGAGKPEHLAEVLSEGKADAALIASMVHYGSYSIAEIKQHLDAAGLPVRLKYRPE